MRTVIRCMHQGRKRVTEMRNRSYTGAVIFFASLLFVSSSRGQERGSATVAPSANGLAAPRSSAESTGSGKDSREAVLLAQAAGPAAPQDAAVQPLATPAAAPDPVPPA